MKVLAALLVNALFNFLIGLIVARFLGPEEFGRFALATALALTVQVALFDWIRLAAIRFYSEETQRSEPEVRATLDVSYVAAVATLLASAGALLAVGPAFSLPAPLLGLALGACVINGLFDYSTGLLRASFADATYARLVIVKNAFALGLIAGGAILFGSAEIAMVGGALSLGGAVLLTRAALMDRSSPARLASWPLARRYLGYAAPIVAANLLYLFVPLVNRTIVTHLYGFAETGQFSLAWDFGQRALQAVGSAIDVILFQMAVAAHAKGGIEAGRIAVARNLGIVVAILAPATLGLWLTLPSIERLIVPSEFRGPFAHYLTLLLPGLFALSIGAYGLNPAFQIEKKNGPMIAAAAVGCLGTPIITILGVRGTDATSLALAQSLAYVAAGLVLGGFAIARAGLRCPPRRDLAATALGCLLLLLTGMPLRALEAGLGTIILQVVAGAIVYAAVALAFDLSNVRAALAERLKATGIVSEWPALRAFTSRKS